MKPVGREEYESISVVLMDLATKAKMMQVGMQTLIFRVMELKGVRVRMVIII